MSVVRQRTAFTASEVKPNLMTGLVEEFLTRPSAIRVYASQELVGDFKMDVQIGNTSIAKDVIPAIQTVAGVIKRSEDLLVSTVGAPGDRIQLRATETAAAVNSLSWMVEISELA